MELTPFSLNNRKLLWWLVCELTVGFWRVATRFQELNAKGCKDEIISVSQLVNKCERRAAGCNICGSLKLVFYLLALRRQLLISQVRLHRTPWENNPTYHLIYYIIMISNLRYYLELYSLYDWTYLISHFQMTFQLNYINTIGYWFPNLTGWKKNWLNIWSEI